MDAFLIGIISFIIIVLGTLIFFFSRYKRCPSDKVLVFMEKPEETGHPNASMGEHPLYGP